MTCTRRAEPTADARNLPASGLSCGSGRSRCLGSVGATVSRLPLTRVARWRHDSVLASALRVTMKNQQPLFCLALVALILAACNRPGASAVPLPSGRVPPVLLFNGTGTSANDVVAIETLLEKSRI